MFPDAVVDGPNLAPRLASVISRHWTTTINKADYDAMGEEPLPGNLPALQTGLVNDVIWEKLPHDMKSADNRSAISKTICKRRPYSTRPWFNTF